jgi:hypothetical protein
VSCSTPLFYFLELILKVSAKKAKVVELEVRYKMTEKH